MVRKGPPEIIFGNVAGESASAEQISHVEKFQYQVPGKEEIYEKREDAKNAIYDFASNFQGFYDSGLDDEPEPVEDATQVSENTFLRFFDTASRVWENCEAAKGDTINPFKDNNLEKVKESVVEDAARVGEAIILSVASKMAEDDNTFSRLLSKLDVAAKLEDHAEEEEDRALLGYAGSASRPVADQVGHILEMASAGEEESSLEEERVDLMKKVFRKVEPVLREHHLLDPIKEFVSTEWLTDEE